MLNSIHYSDKYYDDKFEYRHVILPKRLTMRIPKKKNLSETQWRELGICMSRGWVHYGFSASEPNILLFKRPFSGRGETPRSELEKKSSEYKKKRKNVDGPKN